MLAIILKLAPDAFTCRLFADANDEAPVYEASRATRTRALDAALAGHGIEADEGAVGHHSDTVQSIELLNVRPVGGVS